MSTRADTLNSRSKSIPVVAAFLGGVLIVAVALITAWPLLTSRAASAGVESGLQRGRLADAARLNAEAQYFASQSGTNTDRSRLTEALRLDSMAEFYSASEAARVQQARLAESARLNAAARHFGVDIGVQRGRLADSARYNAEAAYFSAKETADLARGRAAEALRLDGMARLLTHSQ